jgi:iron-sulfur cluster repair protein YtfE (RIC family)
MEKGLRYRLQRCARQIATQHRQLSDLYADLREALGSSSVPRLQRCFQRLCDGMDAHFSLEDEVFFPALHGLCPDCAEDLQALRREHETLLIELERMRRQLEAAELDGFAKAFDGLNSRIEAHESREERLVSTTGALGEES